MLEYYMIEYYNGTLLSRKLKLCSCSKQKEYCIGEMLTGYSTWERPEKGARQGQGCNARKVIFEVYASFVLQCTVSGR